MSSCSDEALQNPRRSALLINHHLLDPFASFRAPHISSPDEIRALATSAIEANNLTLFQEALLLGARPSDYINFILALQPPSPALLVALLDAGPDPNAGISGHHGVLLNAAAATAKVEYVQLLLARGADPNVVGPNATGARRGEGGWMANNLGPLGAAVEGFMFPRDEKEVLKVVEVLVDGGAKLAGSGALQVAAHKGYAECVKLLVRRGANVEESVPKVENGKTAVELAVEAGHEHIAGYLKRCGAD